MLKALKMSNNVILDMIWEDNTNDRFKTIEIGEWEQDGKCQNNYVVFKDTTTDLHYIGWASRSGSPFTDWNYDDYGSETLYPVEKKEVVKYEWKHVKLENKNNIEVEEI